MSDQTQKRPTVQPLEIEDVQIRFRAGIMVLCQIFTDGHREEEAYTVKGVFDDATDIRALDGTAWRRDRTAEDTTP